MSCAFAVYWGDHGYEGGFRSADSAQRWAALNVSEPFRVEVEREGGCC